MSTKADPNKTYHSRSIPVELPLLSVPPRARILTMIRRLPRGGAGTPGGTTWNLGTSYRQFWNGRTIVTRKWPINRLRSIPGAKTQSQTPICQNALSSWSTTMEGGNHEEDVRFQSQREEEPAEDQARHPRLRTVKSRGPT
jgi:hypothetical protein